MAGDAPEAALQRTFARMTARYEAGGVPWDQPLPPPEVTELADALAPGRALDVGCGYGRAALYLAGRGWQVDAVDFVPQAVAETGARVAAAGLTDRVRVFEAAVPDLAGLAGPYDLALDVGCAHGFTAAILSPYRAELARLLRPGAVFALFCRLRPGDDPTEPESGPRGLVEAELRATFADGFRLERAAYGASTSGGGPEWPSAWFWWVRTG
jgi:SAM-dependent methyltransferase